MVSREPNEIERTLQDRSNMLTDQLGSLRKFGFFLLLLWIGSRQEGVANASTGGQTGASSHTWYVRADGGDRKQCTGKADSAYHGKGTSQPCAFSEPYYFYTTGEYGNKRWIVEGGDTMIVRGGPYRIGYKGPNAKDMLGACPGDPYGCSVPSIPSGTPEHPTRLLGENFGNCKQKTQLYGGYAVGSVLNLGGSKNVDLECLELTDHSQCTRVGGGYPASEGCSTSFPLSDYAGSGINTDVETSGISMKDLDIHGFVSDGIRGPIGGLFTIDHVRIAFNGSAGWDFDNGGGTKNGPGAQVNASYLTVEWNGCNEEYPVRHAVPAFSCFDQNSGGYGDGVGTPDTHLDFACDHCTFRYNTQDGLDLLHTSGSATVLTNSQAYGNMGQQWKMGAMHTVRFQNNLTVHNCRRMSAAMTGAPDNYSRYLTLHCRAGGDGIAFLVTDRGMYILQNNSYAGYGNTTYDITCSGGCSSAKIVFQNNLHVGYKDPADGKLPAIFYMQDVPRGVWLARDHNIYFNMRTSCPIGLTEHCSDPKIVGMPAWSGEASLDKIDLHLTAGSSARGAGTPVQGLIKDHDDFPRAAAMDIGAYQYHP
jgi:hypothetical protein